MIVYHSYNFATGVSCTKREIATSKIIIELITGDGTSPVDRRLPVLSSQKSKKHLGRKCSQYMWKLSMLVDHPSRCVVTCESFGVAKLTLILACLKIYYYSKIHMKIEDRIKIRVPTLQISLKIHASYRLIFSVRLAAIAIGQIHPRTDESNSFESDII